ncbi:N-acetyltransferase 9-like protein [Ischnura elegans]|uniref:N-acetyltransferase 9-like protein n=1 Tax=Ischnura elegans TaxID=197161 RepID=UPI001ED86E02|nr:N-acetyltransferase 9-like protein [Ischnura elegans]XP_046383074.1 N-acetyltransferase 9-like protein [Ischnura elegans]XP_046383075.1 N-acetyltransferase 9-like protein [Ischnura elegans]
MRQNSRLMLVGQSVMLLPYKRHMVPKYHEWMKSPDLLQLTASEPLSLEEEYEMQIKWQEDDDKCTFIVLDLDLFRETKDEIESMIGDTNLFFMLKDDNCGLCTAEAEIMIAEPGARRKRRGWEAMIMMLIYGILELKVKKYQAKIGISNSASIQMFEKLGFQEESISEVFQEITLMKVVDEDWSNWLQEQTKMKIMSYDHD